MTKTNDFRFRKGDLLAVALVVALAVLVAVSFLPSASADGVQAQIYHNGELIKTLSLEEDKSVEISGKYTNVITVITKDSITELPLLSKEAAANAILDIAVNLK